MTPFRHARNRFLPYLSAVSVVAVLFASVVALNGSAQAATSADNPTGKLESLQLAPGIGLHATGYATDRNATTPMRVGVYSDGVLVKQFWATAPNAATAPGNHGFDLTLQRPAGTHAICIGAMNIGPGVNTQLGCKTLTFGVDPRGRVETLTQIPNGIRVSGWALDPDLANPINVDIYADGARIERLPASAVRRDIAIAYPAFGANHGFTTTETLPQGRHNICVYALNVKVGKPKIALLCRTMTLNYEPQGHIADIRQVPNGISVSGWALDPDTSAPIRVHVILDGKPVRSLMANLATNRPSAGDTHGFTANAGTTAAGTHQLCVSGMNVMAGVANPVVACHNITLNFTPTGVLESATRGPATRIVVTGWAADPDSPAPIKVQIYLDAKMVATATANIARPDIAQARHIAVAHGFRAGIVVNNAKHSVCVRAINVSAGTSDKTLGCRTVFATHPVAPAAPQVSAVATYGAAYVSWTAGTDGGATPTRFTVRSNSGGKSRVVGSAIRRAVIAGLIPGGRYFFTVTATNVAGTSRPGQSHSVRILREPPPQTTPATISTSRYIRNIKDASSDIAMMRAKGAADAAHNPPGHKYLMLLDIGGQGTYGGTAGVVLSATSHFVSNVGLVRAVNAYVDGYASTRRPNAPAVIAVGTNNDMTVTTATGLTWARTVVNPVAAHAAHYSGVTIAGANDFEPGFTANAAQSKAWLNGYLHGTTRPFVFNGSADGCNWTRISGGCNNGWTASDLYWLSGGASSARIIGLPQIYNTTMAQQWKFISLTGVAGQHTRIRFGGPLTEWTACRQAGGCGSLAGTSAWRALWSAIRSDARTAQSSLPYSTDLRIN